MKRRIKKRKRKKKKKKARRKPVDYKALIKKISMSL
jgi:hypothetical protein